MLPDLQSQAYTKKKATNANRIPRPSQEKKEHPHYQLSNSLSGLNESLGISTIKDNESIDVKQLTLKEKEGEDTGKAKTNEEYNQLFRNNNEDTNRHCPIGKKVTMKGNQVSSGGLTEAENNKLDMPKEKEPHLLFPFTSFNNQTLGGDKQEDMLNYYLNYNKNKDDSTSNQNSKRDGVNSRKVNSNSNTFSFKNFLSHQLRSSPEESKDHSIKPVPPQKYTKRDNCGTKLRETVVNEVIEEDDLTPLPVRKEKIHPIAEYEFNQARSAAVLIRRIEYSYHLKSTRQYKKFERQIIYIQRWWRTMLENRNTNILRDLIEYELRNSNYFPQEEIMRNYTHFAMTVGRVFDRNKMRKAFECLYDNFADLAWYNQTCESVDMIIRAFRKYMIKLKRKSKRRMKYLLQYFYRKLYIRKIIKGKEAFELDLQKITRIQGVIAGYLFRNCDKVLTEIGRRYHPFLYYKIKYNKKQDIVKIINFKRMINKWRQWVLRRKQERAAALTERLKKFFFRYYFDLLLTQIIKKTNSIITIILLKPHKDFLLRMMYQSSLQRYFILWKREYVDKKRKCILCRKIVKRVLAVKVFRPLVRKYKRKVHLIALIKTLNYHFDAKENKFKMLKFKAFQGYYHRSVSKGKKQLLLWKLMRSKSKKGLQHYFTFLRIISMNNSKNIFMVKYGCKEISKTIRKVLLAKYKRDKEALKLKGSLCNSLFYSLIKYFAYAKSLNWLKRLIFNLPIKSSLLASIRRWRKNSSLLRKEKDAYLRSIIAINKRQVKRYMNRYLFKYLRNIPNHPNLIASTITQLIYTLNKLFNRKHISDLYWKLRRGCYRTCLTLLMKVTIEMSKAKVLLHKASFLKALQQKSEGEKTKQSKSHHMLSLRTRDESKLLLKYYYKWIQNAIHHLNKAQLDELNQRQREQLKQISLKRIILHSGRLLIRIGFSQWKTTAGVKTHQLQLRGVMKKKDMRMIVTNKTNAEDRSIRRFWFKWRRMCFDYIKKELNIVEGIRKVTTLNKAKVLAFLISELKNRYNKDKQCLIKKVITMKMSKDENKLRVIFTKWRYFTQYNCLIHSSSLIQDCLRRKNLNKKGKSLVKAIKNPFNQRTLSAIKAFQFIRLISSVLYNKSTAVLNKRFNKWMIQAFIFESENTIITKRNVTRGSNQVSSDTLLRKYVIEIENYSEQVYQYKALQYQVHTELVQFQEIRDNEEIIDIKHLAKYFLRLKEYHQMRIKVSKKRSLFLYWRHQKSLPEIKPRVITYISSIVINRNAVLTVVMRRWLKKAKLISMLLAVKCIQRRYAKYKLAQSPSEKEQ